MGLLRVGALALLPLFACASGCSSTVEGESKDPPVKSYDLAVGATVTLKVGQDARCSIDDKMSTYVCLDARSIKSITKAEAIADGALNVVASRSEKFREDEMLVDVRADHEGGGVLRVSYVDRLDGAKTQDFVIRALPITHVDERVACQFEFDSAGHRYPISRGSKVGVALEAKNADTPLLSGTMNLVADSGGLSPTEVVDTNDGTVSRTAEPSQNGTFTWKLVGERQNTFVLDVYDPETVGVAVTSKDASFVTVRAAVNGAPTCFYGGSGRAMTKVASGACKLVIGDYEAEGDLPVSLVRGGETLLVEGDGKCTVESRIAAGPIGSLTVDGKPATLVDVPKGDAIGTTPIERGGTIEKRGTCIRLNKISNGKCEAINAGGYFVLPDGDCIVDFDWFADPYEDGTANTNPVGVGLLTEVRVGLKLKMFAVLTLKPLVPNALKWSPPTALDVQSLGCDNTSNYEAIQIRPTTEGHNGIHFTADNAPDALDYDVESRNVARIEYSADKLETRTEGTGVTSMHFLRSEFDVKLAYADSNGAKLRGVGPVRISTTDAAANVVYQGTDVFTGTTPNRITLASPAASPTHVIDAVDATAVATIAGVTPKLGGRDTTCIEPYPQSATGQRIYGRSPTRPRVSVTGGDGCGIVGGFAAGTSISTGRNELCAGTIVGKPSAAVTIKWGNATTTWNCQAGQ